MKDLTPLPCALACGGQHRADHDGLDHETCPSLFLPGYLDPDMDCGRLRSQLFFSGAIHQIAGWLDDLRRAEKRSMSPDSDDGSAASTES